MISNYLLITALLYKKRNEIEYAITRAIIIWTVYLYILVLILSSAKALDFFSLASLYTISDLFLLYFVNKDRKNIIDLFEQVTGILKKVKKNKIDVLIGIFLIGLGIVAILAVPFNYDSVTYHAPRICHWSQNKSVFYYATHITRQNVSTILASYIGLVAYILMGKLPAAMCIVQYVAYVINLTIINNLCKKFNVEKTYRQIGTILWLALPIGFAEAITPQNDHVAALWLLLFVTEIVDIAKNDKNFFADKKEQFSSISYLALLVGAAYITKPSVCIAMAIFCIWYLALCIKNKCRITELVAQLFLALPIIIIMALPQIIQNIMCLGSIMAGNVGQRQLVGTIKINYLVVNGLKNLTYNLGMEIGKFKTTGLIEDFLYFVSKLLGVNLNAVEISEDGLIFGYPTFPLFSSDSAINTGLTIIGILAFFIFLNMRKKMDKILRNFICYVYISFAVFSILLRWEVSITRYYIGYYGILIVAVINILYNYTKLYNDRIKDFLIKAMIVITVSLEMCGALLFLWKIHPVMPIKSSMTYYNDRYDSYIEVCQYINEQNIEELGLIGDELTVEYPIWLMLDKNIKKRHVNLDENNPFKRYEVRNIIPDIVLSEHFEGDEIECHNERYSLSFSNDCWNVYEKK